MPRYKITVEYDGTPFVGWQHQENGCSVQDVIEEAFLKFCQQRHPIYVAGRTDAGVHAKGQVFHVDLAKSYPPRTIVQAVNFHLKPHPVTLLAAEEVDQEFHARFSAIARIYQYYILNRVSGPALSRNRVWWVNQTLDVAAMQEGANYLVGTHDFTSFRASQCQSLSPIKSLDTFHISRQEDIIICTVKARSFLHHQVRNMVGTLKMIGQGTWHASKIMDIIHAKNRSAAGMTAPPEGLYLSKVMYE